MDDQYVTLDTLDSGGPAAAENPPVASSGVPGAESPPGGPPPPAGPDLQARISHLESVVQRHGEQQAGSRAEVERWRAEATAQQQLNGQLAQQLQQFLEQSRAAAPAPPRRISLRDAVDAANLRSDYTLLEEYERQQAAQTQPAQGLLTREELETVLTERERRQDASQAKSRESQQLQNALVQRFPDIVRQGAFANQVATRYQEIQQDPVLRSLYPPDASYTLTDPNTGTQYDVRMLLHAAGEVQARGAAGPSPPQSPANGQPAVPAGTLGVNGSGTPPAPAGPRIPRAMVDGAEALLRNPQVQEALRRVGWGNNMKTQAEHLVKTVPASTRERWARGDR